MFENLTLGHILVVVAIALLLFGPKRIPELAGSMGKGIREFKKSIKEVTADEQAEIVPPSQPPRSDSSERDRDAPKRLLN